MTRISGHKQLQEPKLLFGTKEEDTHTHPFKGIVQYGPYSDNNFIFPRKSINCSAIYPSGSIKKVERIFDILNTKTTASDKDLYDIDYPSFKGAFRINIEFNSEDSIELKSNLNSELKNSTQAKELLKQELFSAIDASKIKYDISLVYILIDNDWNSLLHDHNEGYDLHDQIKSYAAIKGVKCQLVKEDGNVYTPYNPTSTAWGLALATYTKAGGTPWKLANSNPDEACIGISYAVRKDPANEKNIYVVCCSQIFDSQGSGMEFLLYQAQEKEVEEEFFSNPYLSRAAMRKVLLRSIEIYRKRHRYIPKKITIHKSNDYSKQEIEGALDALNNFEGIELLQIKDKSNWLGIKTNHGFQADGFSCNRGLYTTISNDEILLWTQGVIKGQGIPKKENYNYFKEGKGIPTPLQVKKFLGSSDWYNNANQILALSKMNWNNDRLYDRVPVTLKYASVIAKTIKQIELPDDIYDYRSFM